MFFAVDSEHNEDMLKILSLWLSLYKEALFFFFEGLGYYQIPFKDKSF